MKDVLTLEGTVLRSFPQAKFQVKFENGHECICQASGRMRQNMIKVVPGDLVKVEFSPYDLNNGRIVWLEHRFV